MQAEYRRDTHHSQLVLYDTEEIRRDSFQTRMFLENTVPGFLPCKKYTIDCQEKFFYDISSRQTLVSMLETRAVSRKCLENLLSSVLRALTGLQNYLLDTEGICLRPEWIFSNPNGSEFFFCYYPGGAFDWREQLQQLAEYLLPRLEHKDRAAVRLGFDFYQCTMEDRVTATELEQLLKDDSEHAEAEEGVFTGRAVQESREKNGMEEMPASREDLLSDFFREEEQEETKTSKKLPTDSSRIAVWLKWIVPVLAGGLCSILLWIFCGGLAAMAAVLLTAAAVSLLAFLRWKKDREQEREETMEQYAMVQDWIEEEKQEERQQEAQEQEKEEQEVLYSEDNATCLLTSEEAYSRLAKGYLVPDSGMDMPTIAVDQPLTMIGKSSQMDVVLKGIGISRIHARIICRENQCFLSDMNSKNGTKLNGILLNPEEEQPLKDGDRITFANAGFEWRCYRL